VIPYNEVGILTTWANISFRISNLPQLFLFISLFNDAQQQYVLEAYSGTAIKYELKNM